MISVTTCSLIYCLLYISFFAKYSCSSLFLFLIFVFVSCFSTVSEKKKMNGSNCFFSDQHNNLNVSMRATYYQRVKLYFYSVFSSATFFPHIGLNRQIKRERKMILPSTVCDNNTTSATCRDNSSGCLAVYVLVTSTCMASNEEIN